MQHHEEAPRDPAAENASTDETLAAFRDLWLNDIQRATSTPTSATSINRLAGPATRERPGEEDRSASPSPERRAHVKQTPTTPLGWYQFAIFSEAEGHLDDALKAYQKAFKLDPRVDEVYKKHMKAQPADAPLASSNPYFDRGDAQDALFSPGIKGPSVDSRQLHEADETPQLVEAILNRTPLSFPPLPTSTNTVLRQTHISALPTELLLRILQHLAWLHPFSIERFGRVSKTAFALSRDESVWRAACRTMYPSITYRSRRDDASDEDVSLRTWFICQPRVRLDGIYVCRINYVRPGMSESTFSQPVHLVSYYRYLRFYADGTCLSLLTPNDPAMVIPHLRKVAGEIAPSTRRRKNKLKHDLHVYGGHWRLQENVLLIRTRDEERVNHMTLRVESSFRGGFNKLVYQSYQSRPVRPEDFVDDPAALGAEMDTTEEGTDDYGAGVKNKVFWFSVVRRIAMGQL